MFDFNQYEGTWEWDKEIPYGEDELTLAKEYYYIKSMIEIEERNYFLWI